MSIFTDFDASYGDGSYTSVPQGDAGVDVLRDGTVVGHVNHPYGASFENGNFVIRTPNLVGGHDTVVDGSLETHTQSNVHGGEDIYHGTHLDQQTFPNAAGGVDIYDGDMQLQGMTAPNVFGGEDYLSMHGNADSILNYDDPLKYATKLRMDPFNAGNL